MFNIGRSAPVALTEYVDALEDALGIKANRHLASMQPGDVPSTFACVDALEAAVGYRPKTSITEGVRRFAQWYKSVYL